MFGISSWAGQRCPLGRLNLPRLNFWQIERPLYSRIFSGTCWSKAGGAFPARGWIRE